MEIFINIAIIYFIGVVIAIVLDFISSYHFNKYCTSYKTITIGDILDEMNGFICYIFSWVSVILLLFELLIYIMNKLRKIVIIKRDKIN